MLRLLRVELERLLYSRTLVASFILFLVYALVMFQGMERLIRSFGAHGSTGTGAMYMYLCLSLAFYPFLAATAIILAGGGVSQDVNAGTLRYTLLAPVGRTQILLAKFVVLVVSVSAVVLFLFLLIGGIGMILLGSGNAVTIDVWGMASGVTRPQTLFSMEELLQRCMLALPLIVFAAVGNAAPAFLISSLVGTPLLAITIPLGLFFISSILQFSQFFPKVRPYLLTQRMFFWDSVFSRDVGWERIQEGMAFYGTVTLVCVGLAITLFVTRDVVS
jgi:ABC-2 type transport system permease protein